MIFVEKLAFCCIKILTCLMCCCIFTVVKKVKETFMKRMVLPLGVLLFVIACGDDPSSAIYEWAENKSSSSSIRNDVESSSSSRKNVNSSSSSVIVNSSSSSLIVSSSSRHSEPDPESSSSLALSSSSETVSSSSKEVSSSSVAQSSSSSWITSSSSSVEISSSSEVLSSSSAGLSSSSVALSSSSAELSSSSTENSSSSEILTDPSKIFEIRKPQAGVLPCEVSWGGDEVQRDTLSQQDIICTYDYNGEKGFLYVQLTPNSCAGGMSITPGSYNVDKAEFYVNGEFADVSNVKYEWGGNHHVEKLDFTYNGNVFRYAQSTMGWGGRPCQRMDCLKVFESDGKTYVENGCNERSLPIVCRNVNGNGEIVGDFTDKYKVCEGDPRTLGYEVEY